MILNLDPLNDDFLDQTERLEEYKIGDYWRFTFHLPKIFYASNVYNRYDLVARHGEIQNYDFIDFTNTYDKKTTDFSAQTKSTDIALTFYTRQEALSNTFGSARIITVHYQSNGGMYSGIMDAPLVGTETAVQSVPETSQNLLISFAMLAILVFAVLVALSVLERTKEFVSAIVWVFGIFALLLARFLIGDATAVPLLWLGVSLSMSFVILLGALLAMGENFGKFPAKYIFPALSLLGALFAFIIPFIPYSVASAMKTVCLVIKAICALALVAHIGFAIFKKDNRHGILQSTCTVAIAVSIVASLFLPQIFPAQINSMFWLCAFVTVITFIGVFIVFIETKKANVYLTANLNKEVERQVKDIKAVISERDSLLQFVSHDMKKPLVSSTSLIDTLIERETDDEQIKTLKIVKQNTAHVVDNLSEIAVFAKFNYIAEPSQVVDLCELCEQIYEFHHPDCNANGIVFENLVSKNLNAFVKKQGLKNVVSNLILNAVEHANCHKISLFIKPDRNNAVLCIADDGKGIDENIDIFKPYVSENNTETGGVGLYICKNIIESMNGDLTYRSDENGTVFYISLLKA